MIPTHGLKVLKFIELMVLCVIALATIVAIGQEVVHVIKVGLITLADLLLLFIYLEVLTMVVHYAREGKLPVRMPMNLAIVALTRYLIIDVKSMSDWRVATIALSTLLLAIAVIIVRWGQTQYSYDKKYNNSGELNGDKKE